MFVHYVQSSLTVKIDAAFLNPVRLVSARISSLRLFNYTYRYLIVGERAFSFSGSADEQLAKTLKI